MRITYYKDEDFHLEYVKKYNEVFLHCTVFNWKLSSLRKGFKVFGRMMNEFANSGVSRLVTVTPNPKFVQMMGGQFLHKHYEDNKEYEVYQWVLKQL